jgi:hypothetical protein
MKLKALEIAVLSAMALTAFAGTASATTLEIGGVPQGLGSFKIKGTLAPKTSTLLTDTGGFFANTCAESNLEELTELPFTDTGTNPVGGVVWGLTFSSCSEGNIVIDEKGILTIAWISKSPTNGTVRSTGAKLTVPSFFGTLTCTTSNTDTGTLTGVKTGKATIDINAVLSCSVVSTVRWSGTYVVTSPEGLGVTE